jgi:cytidyltransferase-like protein
MKYPKRLAKYNFGRDIPSEEVPWVRVAELGRIDLPRPIVIVNGAFDLLHSGHMKIIFQARRRAATLIVAIDSDARVSRKGAGRPVQSVVERIGTLNFLPVDYVVEIHSDGEMRRLMEVVRPDLRVQGMQYKGQPTKFPDVPKLFVRQGGMSTTKIIERCKRVAGSE